MKTSLEIKGYYFYFIEVFLAETHTGVELNSLARRTIAVTELTVCVKHTFEFRYKQEKDNSKLEGPELGSESDQVLGDRFIKT